MKRIPQLAILVVMLLSFFDTAAKAEATVIVDHPTDFWFDYSEPTHFVARTYQSGNLPSDPQLWLYTESGELIFTNDDFYGLQSNIDMWILAGRYRLRASTCCYEPDVWRSDSSGVWNVQYELYYDGLQTVPTTTTEVPTTTTEVPTTTTEVTTSLPAEVSTTTTQAELPTTTLPEEPTWPPTTESIAPTTTSTTIVPTTTVPVTNPPTTSTSAPTTIVPVTTIAPTTTDTPTTTAPELPSEPSTTPPTAPETTTTTLPPIVEGEALEPEIAVAYATNPEVLAVATASEATEIFDAIIVEDLTPEQAAEIIEAVQEAPPEVREAFEEEINVFDGTFDTYIPLGSAIPVSTRRTVTAAIAAIGITTPISSRKKTK